MLLVIHTNRTAVQILETFNIKKGRIVVTSAVQFGSKILKFALKYA